MRGVRAFIFPDIGGSEQTVLTNEGYKGAPAGNVEHRIYAL